MKRGPPKNNGRDSQSILMVMIIAGQWVTLPQGH